MCCSHVEKFGGKRAIMNLLYHEDKNVRYEALLALQKIMVHHWYVGGNRLIVNLLPKLIVFAHIKIFKIAIIE